jgi:hypothetical protein
MFDRFGRDQSLVFFGKGERLILAFSRPVEYGPKPEVESCVLLEWVVRW